MKWNHGDWELTQTKDACFEFHQTCEPCFNFDQLDEARFELLDADIFPLASPAPRVKEKKLIYPSWIKRVRLGLAGLPVVERSEMEDEEPTNSSSLAKLFVTMLVIHLALIGSLILFDFSESIAVTFFGLVAFLLACTAIRSIVRVVTFAELWAKTVRASESVAKAVKLPSTCADAPLAILKCFRWFLPRTAREEIDLSISDLKDDRRDLKKQKRSAVFIFLVLAWHCIRIISAYMLDVFFGFLHKLLPFASVLSKNK